MHCGFGHIALELKYMKKREWTLVLIPLIITIFLDQITKVMALGLSQTHLFGFVGFSLHFNKGAMLGLFSGLPPILRVVSLSTGGAFLLFTYVIIQYLLPIRSLMLRAGMSVLMGGILGNVIDRTLMGHVVDFLFFQVGQMHSPVMNVADILQWLGYGLVVTALIRDGDQLWPENNSRRYYWINPGYQLKYCFTLLLVGIGYACIAGVFSYTFLKYVLQDLVGANNPVLNQFLNPFVITFSIFSTSFSAFLFLIGKKLSHRSAGPIYAFERFLDDFIAGKSRPLKLRTGDDFLELQELAQKVIDHLEVKELDGEADKPDKPKAV